MRDGVDQLRNCIFDQDTQEFMRLIAIVLDEVEKRINNLPPPQIVDCNGLLHLIFASLQHKDYLNAADILKFDLIPMLERETSYDSV